jgi:hypothetical protein
VHGRVVNRAGVCVCRDLDTNRGGPVLPQGTVFDTLLFTPLPTFRATVEDKDVLVTAAGDVQEAIFVVAEQVNLSIDLILRIGRVDEIDHEGDCLALAGAAITKPDGRVERQCFCDAHGMVLTIACKAHVGDGNSGKHTSEVVIEYCEVQMEEMDYQLCAEAEREFADLFIYTSRCQY